MVVRSVIFVAQPSTVKKRPLVSPWSKIFFFLIGSKVESPLTSHVSFVESQIA